MLIIFFILLIFFKFALTEKKPGVFLPVMLRTATFPYDETFITNLNVCKCTTVMRNTTTVEASDHTMPGPGIVPGLKISFHMNCPIYFFVNKRKKRKD